MKAESTQIVQTSAEDFHVLLRIATVNKKESFKKFLDPDRNPDRHQNLNECSLIHAPPLEKISAKSVHNCWSNLADRQTNRQIDKGKNITCLPRRRYTDKMQKTANNFYKSVDCAVSIKQPESRGQTACSRRLMP